jgi:hypothetical protein
MKRIIKKKKEREDKGIECKRRSNKRCKKKK